MIWTVKGADRQCGSCGLTIHAGDPFALVTAKALVRCVGCAGAPVDEAAVDGARVQLEREAIARESSHTSMPQAPRADRGHGARAFVRVGTLLSFDAKAAAAGDRE